MAHLPKINIADVQLERIFSVPNRETLELFNIMDREWISLLSRAPTDVVNLSNTLRALPAGNRYGIEIELEKFPANWAMGRGSPTAVQKTDGTLRDNGREIVSLPLLYYQAPVWLWNCYTNVVPKTAVSSQRCSTHIHTNVLDMSLSQFASFLLLYTAYENVLFNFCDPGRKGSIFCAPIQDTNTFQILWAMVLNGGLMNQRVEKYAAFNAQPLSGRNDHGVRGTVEFRHLDGCTDPKRLFDWLTMIHSMRTFASVVPFDVVSERLLSLNSNSEYDVFTQDVFMPSVHDHVLSPDLGELMEDGIRYIKSCIYDNPRAARSETPAASSSFVKAGKKLLSPGFGGATKKVLEEMQGLEPEGLTDHERLLWQIQNARRIQREQLQQEEQELRFTTQLLRGN